MAHSVNYPPDQKTPSKAHAHTPSTETLQSPLHRLEAEFSRGFPYYSRDPGAESGGGSEATTPRAETESIYSFDSVSTNGRLLDRLELAANDVLDHDAYLCRRESMASIQSTGRLLDRLGLEDASDDNVAGAAQTRPILPSSAASLDRLRSLNRRPTSSSAAPALLRQPSSHSPQKNALQRTATSHDSLHGDFVSSSSSLLISGSLPGNNPGPGNSSRNNSGSSLAQLGRKNDAAAKRSASEASNMTSASNANTSSVSLETSSIFNPCSRFDPSLETATKQALTYRTSGNHREASYQLQLLANTPHNYPKAMYLYAKALALGQGVKQNEAQYVRWLCRCIYACTLLESTDDLGTLNSHMLKLANVPTETSLTLVKQNVDARTLDPHSIYSQYSDFGSSALNKLISLNSADKNVAGGAYYLLGQALVLGNGVPSKEEELGRMLLAKSASLAYGDAMVKLGELWSAKSKGFKKDYYIASAWLRLGELFGKKDIGNSWIHKEKYLKKKK